MTGKTKKTGEYDYHAPVLLESSLEYLIEDTSGNYADGTLGGGGHAQAILQRLDSGGKLTAFDKDPEAMDHCRRKFAKEIASGRMDLINDSYSEISSVAGSRGLFNGLLLDLGVSSRQLDTESRGLSYRVKAPLDMRFGEKGKTAEEIVNSANAAELERIFSRYGEEPLSRVIARRIVERRRGSTLKTTFDLRLIVEELTSGKKTFKTLSRIFQALRIAVNDELGELERTLNDSPEFLNHGGRIVVISYHSLEDRIVKNTFKDLAKEDNLKIITPKPITPAYQETKKNKRARSAKMRVGELD